MWLNLPNNAVRSCVTSFIQNTSRFCFIRKDKHCTSKVFHFELFINRWKWKSFTHVQHFVTPWIVTHQAPLSLGFSREEYWSGVAFPSPGDIPDPETEPRSPSGDSLPSAPPVGFPCGSEVIEYPYQCRRHRSLGFGPLVGGNGNPLQYSCLGNPMDREAWWATGHRVAKNRTQLNNCSWMHAWYFFLLMGKPDWRLKKYKHQI